MTRERVQLLERVHFVKQVLTGAHHPGTTQCWTAAWLIVIHDYPFTPMFRLGVVSKVRTMAVVGQAKCTRSCKNSRRRDALLLTTVLLAGGDFRALTRMYFARIGKIRLLTVTHLSSPSSNNHQVSFFHCA